MLATDRPTALARQPEILSGSAAGTDSSRAQSREAPAIQARDRVHAWVDEVMKNRWTQGDVERELRTVEGGA